MTERTDHVAEALACEEAGLSIMRKHEMAPHMEAVMQFDLARLHAQLALVEQQRIANLIDVLANAARMVAEGTADAVGYAHIYAKINPQIEKALGLT